MTGGTCETYVTCDVFSVAGNSLVMVLAVPYLSSSASGSLHVECWLNRSVFHARKSDSLGAGAVDVLSTLYLFSFDGLFLECADAVAGHLQLQGGYTTYNTSLPRSIVQHPAPRRISRSSIPKS
ncbi:hypothetical protein Bca101_046421 [Brassica carinata]